MSEPHVITVLSVDDHPLLQEGIAAVINNQADMRIVAEASNGQEAVTLYRALQPDITLMDVRMQGMDGIEAMLAIRQEFPAARVIILTTYLGDVQALRAIKSGAMGYVLKSSLRLELVQTIRSVMAGKRHIPPDVAVSLAENATQEPISAREVQVLKLVAAGKSNKAIAQQLFIAEETVKAHMRSILAKLSAQDRTHAVTIALKRGIIDI